MKTTRKETDPFKEVETYSSMATSMAEDVFTAVNKGRISNAEFRMLCEALCGIHTRLSEAFAKQASIYSDDSLVTH